MKNNYYSEIEGMIDFWEEITPKLSYPFNDNIYVCNTDGRTRGCLVEFKLNGLETTKNIDQMKKYISAYNTSTLPIPKFALLVSLNQKIFHYYDTETWNEIVKGTYVDASDLLLYVDVKDNRKGWICEESLVAYSDKYFNTYNKKSKDDFIKEIQNPSVLNIEPYNWFETGKMERELLDCIGPIALKKRLGAFFTPDYAVQKSTDYLRHIIDRQPDDNWCIVDTSCGTGNLEKFLTDEELSHCILNTYVYAEWLTLKGLYGGRCTILPKDNSSLNSEGLLEDGDALSEKCCNAIKKVIGNRRAIFLENPPYGEPQSEATRTGNTIKGTYNNYVTTEMKKVVKGKASTDLSNKFIWKAFNIFNCDSYIVYSPIKYWKSQHLIDKKLNEGIIVNRKDFHATEGGISLISWDNINTNNTELVLENTIIKKVIKGIGKLYTASNDDPFDFMCTCYSGSPNFKNGFLSYNTKGAGNAGGISKCKVSKQNLEERIPLFVANCYSPQGFLEKEIIMKSADKGLLYMQDQDFLDDCITYAVLTDKNKCIATNNKQNEMCYDGNAKVRQFIKFSNRNSKILQDWNKVLQEAKKCIPDNTDPDYNYNGYNPKYNYGLEQIIKDLNTSKPSKNNLGEVIKDKTNKIKMEKRYPDLDTAITILKKDLKEFYDTYITPKLFKYELLK